MNSHTSFVTPIENFRRLIEHDFSDKFQICLSFPSNEKDIINLSRNEARVISKKINDFCLIDPTVNQYELLFGQNSEKEEIKNLLKQLIRSAREQIAITKEKQKEFAMIRFLLGEDGSELYDIQNEKEAISLLSTEMNYIAIKYLSEHFLELIESGETKNLNENIIYSIIDEYFLNVAKEQQEREIEKIFSAMKTQEEEKFVIHFILQSQIDQQGEISKEIIQYLISNLDDEIVINELPRITPFIQHFLEIVQKVTIPKGQIINCDFNGDELLGIVSHLKKKFGNDIVKSGVVKLNGGGYHDRKQPITNLIKYDSGSINQYYYNWEGSQSSKKPSGLSDSWIEFDFLNRKVNLTSYTIRTDKDDRNTHWKPKTWKIYGSNDHDKWTLLDSQTESQDLNDKHSQHRFKCNKNNAFFQYIKYVQEDSWNSSSCKYSFSLTCIEMFGSILEPSS